MSRNLSSNEEMVSRPVSVALAKSKTGKFNDLQGVEASDILNEVVDDSSDEGNMLNAMDNESEVYEFDKEEEEKAAEVVEDDDVLNQSRDGLNKITQSFVYARSRTMNMANPDCYIFNEKLRQVEQ